jgi:predicted PurR-regulated permease PerM
LRSWWKVRSRLVLFIHIYCKVMEITKTSISTGTIVRFFAIAVLLVALYYLFDVILVILAAVVIASAIEPVVRRLGRRGINRTVSVVGIYVMLTLILVGVTVFVLPLVLRETAEFLNNLPRNISLQELWSPLGEVSSSGAQALKNHTISATEFINGLQSIVVGTGGDAFQTISIVFGGLLSFIIIFVLSFYLSVKKDGIDEFLRIVTPVHHHEYGINLWKRSQRKMALWLQGQVLLGLIVGTLVYFVLLIVGVPHPLLLAILAAVVEIIPVFGPILAAIPAVLVAFSTSGIGTSLLIVGLYLVIHQLENHLIYPLVVRKIVGISPIVVILALLIGAKLAGVLGVLVAVPFSAAFMEYISDIEKGRKEMVKV